MISKEIHGTSGTDPTSKKVLPEGLQSLYERLMEIEDPAEKRVIRSKISKIEPSVETFRFILGKYYTAQGDEEKSLHLQSIIAQINSSDFVEELKTITMKTKDVPLMISFVYSLRLANTVEAKKALFDLMKNNQLPESKQYRKDNLFDNQGVAAIYRSLMDTLNKDDLGWLGEYEKSTTITPAQLYTINNLKKKL